MSTQPDLDQLAAALFTPELVTELGVVRDPAPDEHNRLQFRLDPGNLFERHALVRGHADGAYRVSVSRRYRPHEPLLWVAGAEAELADVPGVLRSAVRYARDRDAELPHWLATRRRETPPLSLSWSDTDYGDARDAVAACATQARRAGAVMYLSTQPGLITCSNNPPENGPFFSVTSAGKWAVHWRVCTRPLLGPPKPAVLVDPVPSVAAQVAGLDRPQADANASPAAEQPQRPKPGHAISEPRRIRRSR